MKTGHYVPCRECGEWTPVLLYDTPPKWRPLCASCTLARPKPSRARAALKRVWQPIRSRLRLTVAAVAVLLYVVAVGSMAAIMWVR